MKSRFLKVDLVSNEAKMLWETLVCGGLFEVHGMCQPVALSQNA